MIWHLCGTVRLRLGALRRSRRIAWLLIVPTSTRLRGFRMEGRRRPEGHAPMTHYALVVVDRGTAHQRPAATIDLDELAREAQHPRRRYRSIASVVDGSKKWR